MRRLTTRRLFLAGILAGVVGAAGLSVAVRNDVLSLADATALGFAAAALGMLSLLALGLLKLAGNVRHLGAEVRKLRSGNSPGWAQELAVAVTTMDRSFTAAQDSHAEELVEQHVRAAQVTERLNRLDKQLEVQVTSLAHLANAVDGWQSRMLTPVTSAIQTVSKEQVRLHERLYAKVEAQADLRGLIHPRAPMPALSGWAIDADILHLVVETIWRRRPHLIVECGSGASSVWLGYFAERVGVGRVVALEHDERFLKESRDLIEEHGLQGIVEIRHAPLEPWHDEADGETRNWYALKALEGLTDIGLLLVDGPPAAVGKQSRFPAGPLLLTRCSEDAVVILDDVHRDDEQVISDRWVKQWPGFARSTTAKGAAHVFRAGDGQGS